MGGAARVDAPITRMVGALWLEPVAAFLSCTNGRAATERVTTERVERVRTWP